MEVNSKYNINDIVWVVNRNKVIQQKIQSVETTSYVNEKEIVKTEINENDVTIFIKITDMFKFFDNLNYKYELIEM